MTSRFVSEVIAYWGNVNRRVHTEDCWKVHAECAVKYLSHEVKCLNELLDSYSAALQRAKEQGFTG